MPHFKDNKQFVSLLAKIYHTAMTAPSRLSLMDRDNSLNYGELAERLATLAFYLVRHYPTSVTIGVLLPPSLEVYIAQLGILAAGKAYIPLSPTYPSERILHCLKDAQSTVLLTSEVLLKQRPELASGPFIVLTIEQLITKAQLLLAQEELTLEDLPLIDTASAFLIVYTSGSTGKPKGISLTHQAVVTLCGYTKENQPLSLLTAQRRRILAVTQTSFVAALFNYMALYNGGTAYIPSSEDFSNFTLLAQHITRNNITSLFCTPSFLRNFLLDRSGRSALSRLSVLMLGGEVLDASLVRKLLTDYPRLTLINPYGATESGGPCVAKLLTAQDELITVGKPLAQTRCVIVGENGQEVPLGAKGELLLLGERLSTGYIGEAKRRNAAFSTYQGERAFRTGDLAYQTPAGDLVLAGRLDDMVKFHGQRIELGEIEAALYQYPTVRQAKALLRVANKDMILVAFFSADTVLAPSELRKHLLKLLPEYMVPQMLLQLAELPLNSSKKIDRKALENLALVPDKALASAPENEMEATLCQVFSKCLAIPPIGATADFFASGATSLSLAVFITELSRSKAINLSYSEIVLHSTPRLLATYLATRETKELAPQAKYPLTQTQAGIYRELMLGLGQHSYAIRYLLTADPTVTPDALRTAIHSLVAAHPQMLYKLEQIEDTAFMVPAPDEELTIPLIEGTEDERYTFAASFLPHLALTNNLLFHSAIYRTSERCYLLVRTHLIFTDASAMNIIIGELSCALQGQQLLGEKEGLFTFAQREHEAQRSPRYKEAKKYFLELFQDMEDIPSLTGDLPGPATAGASRGYNSVATHLSVEAVEAYCAEHKLTANSFFLGALGLTLSKYLHRSRVSYSFIHNGRQSAATLTTIGTLIKRLPIYADLAEDITVSTYLRNLTQQITTTISHSIYPFDEVLRSSPVNGDIEFLYQGKVFTDDMVASTEGGPLRGDPHYVENYVSGMLTGCLSLALFTSGGRYTLHTEYRHELFSEEYVRTFAAHFFLIASQMLTAKRLSEIVMLTEEERSCLAKINTTNSPIPFSCVHDILHQHALAHPEKAAVVTRRETVTYRALDETSTIIARYLLSLGVKSEEMVAVLLPRIPLVYCAEYGILQAAATFVPFADDCPPERLATCLANAKVRYVLTTEELKAKYQVGELQSYEFIAVAEIVTKMQQSKSKPLALPTVNKNNLAYSIYTSGSTGEPKGVLIEHGSLTNYVSASPLSPEITHYAKPGRVCLALAAFSFDLSLVETFCTLSNGNTICLATTEEIHEPELLAKLMTKCGVDALTCTPSYLQNLLPLPVMHEALERITFYDIGAENFPTSLYAQLRRLRTDSVIMNVYGPTECTMGCTAGIITAPTNITCGRPNANTQLAIVDTFGNPLPAGIEGELIIAGVQVARGYNERPLEQAKAFITYSNKRAYRSGDLAQWSKDYQLIIHGRADHQVKVRGYRIELSEIERVMSTYPAITCAVATPIASSRASLLAGFYTASSHLERSLLRSYLQRKLPPYMVPDILINLSTMPLTTNGKIDRVKLSRYQVASTGKAYVKPHNEVEAALCAAYAAVLRLPEKTISADDDFFELGGTSLTAMAVIAMANLQHFSVALLYQHRTAVNIAAALAEATQFTANELLQKELAARKKKYRLRGQQMIFFNHQLRYSSSSELALSRLLKYSSTIDPERLALAVSKVLAHHSAFATYISLSMQDGHCYQSYDSALPRTVTVEYLSEENFLELLPTLLTPLPVLATRPYNFRIIRTPNACYLFSSVHHTIMDGFSFLPLNHSIALAYQGKDLPPDYLYSYLAQQEEYLNSSSCAQEKDYYQALFGETTWCTLPPPDLAGESSIYGTFICPLKISAQALSEGESYYHSTRNNITLTASLLTLAQVSGQDAVCVEWLYANRGEQYMTDIIGTLFLSLPVALHLSEYSSPSELVHAVDEQVKQSILLRGNYYQTSKENMHSMECYFHSYVDDYDMSDELGGTDIEIPPHNQEAPGKFIVNLIETPEGLKMHLDYDAACYSHEKIESIAATYEKELLHLLRNKE